MVGRGRYSELPPEETTLPANVDLYTVSLNIHLEQVQGRFGPEYGLAHALGPVFRDQTLVLVKYAVDAASMLDWAPDWDSDAAATTGHPEFGPLYHKLMALVAQARDENPSCLVAAVFWMQGERDASIPAAGERYQENLITLIQRFREDLGHPDLPFLLGHIDPPGERYPAVEVVQRAQARTAELLPNTGLISTAGLPKLPDGLHYDTAGQIELGQRFAQAYTRLCPELLPSLLAP
jgi:hypothetical protein